MTPEQYTRAREIVSLCNMRMSDIRELDLYGSYKNAVMMSYYYLDLALDEIDRLHRELHVANSNTRESYDAMERIDAPGCESSFELTIKGA